ncbi:hypothetical protein WS94_15785 [Burkholderia territorii]|nr:hypothetical protein WS94_15785 [Burkholderia territorii]
MVRRCGQGRTTRAPRSTHWPRRSLRRERVVGRRNVQVLTRLAGEIEQSLVTERETPRNVDALERLHDAWRVP